MVETEHLEHDEQVVVFEVAGESYGIDITCVQEIIRRPAITAVPRAPQCVEGVMNLRGRVIPVVNLRERFNLPAAEPGRMARIIVLEYAGQLVGFAVDAVAEVLRVPPSAVEAPGATLTGPENAHLRGIAKCDDRLVVLLNLDLVVDLSHVITLAA